MVFKDAFAHYKAGQATPEETAYIEEELEKNALISEYIEDDFTVNLAKEEIASDEVKKVKKSI
jgi:hypothetical protein